MQHPNYLADEKTNFSLDTERSSSESTSQRWWKNYEALITFHQRHGHYCVPHSARDAKYAQLYSWLSYQRRLHKSGKLSCIRQRYLNGLGIDLKPSIRHDELWFIRFKELQTFRQKYGHTDVPSNYEDNKTLARWCMTQRQLYYKGKLRRDRRNMLEQLGFRYEHRRKINQRLWEKNFRLLQVYKKRYGHSHVSTLDKQYEQLARWISDQRNKYYLRELSTDKINKLEKLGFIWSIPELRWDEKYRQAREYQRLQGHLKIPSSTPEFKTLDEWLKRQRQLYKQKRLPRHRRLKLESLGLCFRPHDESWEKMYQRLCHYVKTTASFVITKSADEDACLANWIRRQRKAFKNDTLSQERINKLNNIGFPWEGKRGRPVLTISGP